MQVFFVGNEPEAFDIETLGSMTFTTDYANVAYDPLLSRGCLFMTGNAVLIANMKGTPPLEFWCSFSKMSQNSATTATNEAPVTFRTSDGDGFLRIFSPNRNTFRLERWNGSAWQTIGDAFSYGSETVHKCVFHVFIDDTAGFIRFYLNGTLERSFDGDTNTRASSGLASIRFQNKDTSTTIATARLYYSNFLVTDEDNRNVLVKTLFANGDGFHDDWTGTYTDIASATDYNNASFISSATAGEKSTFDINDMTGLGIYDIVAMVISAKIAKGTTGPQNVDSVLRVGSTDYNAAFDALDTVFKPRQHAWYNNPATSTNWVFADIPSLQIGVESKT